MALATKTSAPSANNPKTGIPTTTKMVPKGKSGKGVKGSNQGKATVPNNSANKAPAKATLKTGKNNPNQRITKSGRVNHNMLRRMK